jgi:hypothetical protein
MQTYTGGCHCGKVRFEVEVDLASVMECNCSHCQIKGLLLVFTPAEKFRLISGEESLADYHFNKHVIDHLFCKECGVESFGRGKRPSGEATVAINVRSLKDVDITILNRVPFDGRSK